jgi:hypothetical protein
MHKNSRKQRIKEQTGDRRLRNTGEKTERKKIR